MDGALREQAPMRGQQVTLARVYCNKGTVSWGKIYTVWEYAQGDARPMWPRVLEHEALGGARQLRAVARPSGLASVQPRFFCDETISASISAGMHVAQPRRGLTAEKVALLAYHT